MKTRLAVGVLMLFFCSMARADGIETIAIPGDSLVVAMYSGFGETRWDGRYDFPEFIGRNGEWQGIEVAFTMPPDGGSFSLETESGQVSVDIFGTGIGELWSFNGLAMPNDPITLNAYLTVAEISMLVFAPDPDPPQVSAALRVSEPSGFYLLSAAMMFLFWKRRALQSFMTLHT